MIIGFGLLAREFLHAFSQRDDVCIYAAGVSNSSCTDNKEFSLEFRRLGEALNRTKNVDAFVYLPLPQNLWGDGGKNNTLPFMES